MDLREHFIKLKEYYSELNNSKISIAPFGWGEITYRDFETFNSGAILIKPDMDHILTWPNYYEKNYTYIPINWDCKDLINQINYCLDNYDKTIQIAYNAQDLYKKYTIEKNSSTFFFERFINLLNEI